MSKDSQLLLALLELASAEERVFILQSYIAERGPVPDEIGEEVRKLLEAP